MGLPEWISQLPALVQAVLAYPLIKGGWGGGKWLLKQWQQMRERVSILEREFGDLSRTLDQVPQKLEKLADSLRDVRERVARLEGPHAPTAPPA